MFSVIFEAHPRPDRRDAYFQGAKALRPELEQIDGFVDNVRYDSLTRDGWLLSLSNWRDEKSLVRWRTRMRHHEMQETGRAEILLDYHLRVGQLTADTRLPAGYQLHEQRLDETETGQGTAAVLIDATRPADWVDATRPRDLATWLGLDPNATALVAWDVFHAVLTPGDIVVLSTWRDHRSAGAFGLAVPSGDGRRVRRIRVVRDYGMFDRREAPQYYPDVPRTPGSESDRE
jgi:heme-degrading monooxygenase HmoA